MKKVIFTLAAFAMSYASFAQLADGTYNVDYKSSTINWHAEKATGSGHDGTIRVSSGQVVVAKSNIASGKLKVDMNGIACTDLPEGEYNSNLINHLKSPDFFDTAKFPDSNFEVTSVTAKADGKGNTHVVAGKITIKGITKDITFPAKVSGDGKSVTIDGDVVLDRSQFDVRFGSETFFGSLGDKAINNDMKLKLHIVANKKA
jgi:polyisoprenoid-binding protein YceI